MIVEYVDKKVSSAKRKYETGAENGETAYHLSFVDIAELSQLRNRFEIMKGCFFSADPLFRDILAEAKTRINSWGGRLYLVYLPTIDRYLSDSNRCSNYSFSKHKTMILSMAKELEIPVVDIQESLASRQDIYSLFPFRLKFRGHFNAEGYRIVAEELTTKLQLDEKK